jgi:hypothetical protein
MNMVAVLGVPLMLAYDPAVVKTVNAAAAKYPDAIKTLPTDGGNDVVRWAAILVTLFLIAWAIWQSKRTAAFEEQPADSTGAGVAAPMAK